MAKLQGSRQKVRPRALVAAKAGKTAASQKVLKLNRLPRATAAASGERRTAKAVALPAPAPLVVLWDEMGAGRRFGFLRRS